MQLLSAAILEHFGANGGGEIRCGAVRWGMFRKKKKAPPKQEGTVSSKILRCEVRSCHFASRDLEMVSPYPASTGAEDYPILPFC